MKLEPSDIEALRPLLVEIAYEAAKKAIAEADVGPKRPRPETNGRVAYGEAELAQMMGLEIHHIREQRRLGKIDFCRGPGRRIMYTPSQIEAYLNREKNGNNNH